MSIFSSSDEDKNSCANETMITFMLLVLINTELKCNNYARKFVIVASIPGFPTTFSFMTLWQSTVESLEMRLA